VLVAAGALVVAACGNGDSGVHGLGRVPSTTTTATDGSVAEGESTTTLASGETTTSVTGESSTSTSLDESATSTTGPSTSDTASTAPATTTAPGPTTSGPGGTATTAPGTTAGPTTTKPPGTTVAGTIKVKLTRVSATVTWNKPVAFAARPSNGVVYIGEKDGRVRRLSDGFTILDIHTVVSTGPEQGLRGIAFSPDSSRLYVSITDKDGAARLLEYVMFGTGQGVDIAFNRRDVLVQAQPSATHNAGHIAFGPDGYLYYGLGDGGGTGDPQENAENLGTLLGKILRINPRRSSNQAYTVPSDNPFFNTQNAKKEIWSYGLRDPWRFSFDKTSGDLWIGDIGQDQWEEIDKSAAPGRGKGVDYGWDSYEGTHRYGSEPIRSGTVMPVFEYAHNPACRVTGGFVYRGTAIPALKGSYLYSDYCKGGVRQLVVNGSTVTVDRDLGVSITSVSSFGEATNGDVYVLTDTGTIARIDPA